MAKVKSNVGFKQQNHTPENLVEQGDFIFCKASGNCSDFWAIYSCKKVVCLDGGGMSYIAPSDSLYVGDNYSYWTVVHKIPCDDAEIIVNDLRLEAKP